tara:strand:- start:882 stop:1391 length:510 start_codon:yes stop_codon:yes gene_type:complete
MSRRIQCNTLSVKPRPDGVGGNIECDTLHCKNVICENKNNETESVEKVIKVPYNLPITHISLGLMGSNETDASNQSVYIPCSLQVNKLQLTWHDWYPGYPEETVHLKVGEHDWQTVILKESQTIVDCEYSFQEGDKLTTRLYTNVEEQNEPAVQSLSVVFLGTHDIVLS